MSQSQSTRINARQVADLVMAGKLNEPDWDIAWALYREVRHHRIAEAEKLFSVYRDLTWERRVAIPSESSIIFNYAKKLARHLLAHRRGRKS